VTVENKRRDLSLEMLRCARNLADAQVLLGEQSHETAVSVAYYAALHAARALLLTQGLEARTHAGLVHLLRIHFVQTERLATEQVTALSQLFAQRQDADCDAATTFTAAMAENALSRARAFVDDVRAILQSEGYL